MLSSLRKNAIRTNTSSLVFKSAYSAYILEGNHGPEFHLIEFQLKHRVNS